MKKFLICYSAFLIFAFRCLAGDKAPFEVVSQAGPDCYVQTVTAADLAKSPPWDGNTNSFPTSMYAAKSNALSYARSKWNGSAAWTVVRGFLKPLGTNKWVYVFLLDPPEGKRPTPSGFVAPVVVVVLLNGDVIPAVLEKHPRTSYLYLDQQLDDAIEIKGVADNDEWWRRHFEMREKGRLSGPVGNATNSPDLFRVIVDGQSGQYAAVSGDGRVIALRDRSGTAIWTNDIIAKFGTKQPLYSDGKIESLELIQGQIVIYVGNMSICIDLQSGKITRMDVR